MTKEHNWTRHTNDNAALIASAPDLLAQRDELREALEKIEIAASSPSFKVMHDADALGELVAEIHRLSAHALSRCAAPEAPKGEEGPLAMTPVK